MVIFEKKLLKSNLHYNNFNPSFHSLYVSNLGVGIDE